MSIARILAYQIEGNITPIIPINNKKQVIIIISIILSKLSKVTFFLVYALKKGAIWSIRIRLNMNAIRIKIDVSIIKMATIPLEDSP